MLHNAYCMQNTYCMNDITLILRLEFEQTQIRQAMG